MFETWNSRSMATKDWFVCCILRASPAKKTLHVCDEQKLSVTPGRCFNDEKLSMYIIALFFDINYPLLLSSSNTLFSVVSMLCVSSCWVFISHQRVLPHTSPFSTPPERDHARIASWGQEDDPMMIHDPRSIHSLIHSFIHLSTNGRGLGF